MKHLAEEVLSLVSIEGKIELREIQNRLNLKMETVTTVIDFLVEFGFAELDESNRYVRLTGLYKQFLENLKQDEDKGDRELFAVAYF